MTANRPVTIYISASPNLMAEREALARMIAELPVTLAWHIVQTPAVAEPLDTDALQHASLYFLIMGADIRAPVGLELQVARQAGRSVVAFLKQGVMHTPAGQVFSRQAQVSWRTYVDPAHLSRQVQQVLAEHLLRQALRFSLTPNEVERIQEVLATAGSAEPAVEGDGAGHSAVLLSRERYEPGEGVIIENS